MARKLMKVEPIERGTVIDHIPGGMAFHVVSIIMSGRKMDKTITMAINVKSKDMGKKDIVKVEGLELKKSDVNKISIIAPDATINIIRDGEVVEKRTVNVPKKVTGILKCTNPNCVTNQREPVEREFVLTSRSPITYQCVYCEREVENILDSLV